MGHKKKPVNRICRRGEETDDILDLRGWVHCALNRRWTHTHTNQLQWQPMSRSVTMNKELKIHRCITESSFSFGLDLPWACWGEGVRILDCQRCPGQPIQIQSSDLCCTEETSDKSHRSPCWRRCCTSNDGLNSTNGLNDWIKSW